MEELKHQDGLISMKNLFKNNVKIPKDAGWLIPGLEIKRWLALIFLGSVFIIAGILTLSNPDNVYDILKVIRAAVKENYELVATIVIFIGSILFFKGWQKTNISMLDIHTGKEKESVLETLYRRRWRIL